jgi:hypothetical protein
VLMLIGEGRPGLNVCSNRFIKMGLSRRHRASRSPTYAVSGLRS